MDVALGLHLEVDLVFGDVLHAVEKLERRDERPLTVEFEELDVRPRDLALIPRVDVAPGVAPLVAVYLEV